MPPNSSTPSASSLTGATGSRCWNLRRWKRGTPDAELVRTAPVKSLVFGSRAWIANEPRNKPVSRYAAVSASFGGNVTTAWLEPACATRTWRTNSPRSYPASAKSASRTARTSATIGSSVGVTPATSGAIASASAAPQSSRSRSSISGVSHEFVGGAGHRRPVSCRSACMLNERSLLGIGNLAQVPGQEVAKRAYNRSAVCCMRRQKASRTDASSTT